MTIAFPLRIYYDRQCPLCEQELQALKRYDHGDRLQLVDCSAPDFNDPDIDAAGLAPAQLMALIHARDANGAWLKGVAVFEAAYAAAGIHSVAAMFADPRLRPAWEWLYPHVARHRMALSALGLNRPFGWLVQRAARRAAARAAACHDGRCDVRG